MPAPPGIIWRHPGFPSLFVTYAVGNDFFFSGHTALAVFGAIQLASLGIPALTCLGAALAVGCGVAVYALYRSFPAVNPIRPVIQDLDTLPFPDVEPHDKYLVEDDRLTENFGEISYSGRYHLMGSRGCPFRCGFCSISAR